jgi:hypothetical protein
LPELVRTVKIRYGYTRIDYLGMVRHFLPPCYKLIFAANDQGNLLKINQPKHWCNAANCSSVNPICHLLGLLQ